jgi:hypothetical protein
MLFLGSDKYPSPDEMRQVLGRLGMSQLADANAYTDFRSTVRPSRYRIGRGKDAPSARLRVFLFLERLSVRGMVWGCAGLHAVCPDQGRREAQAAGQCYGCAA